MGLILDTSILIAYEKGKFELPLFLDGKTSSQAMIAVLRKEIIEGLLQSILVLPFTLHEAQVHARIWADLVKRGQLIGSHDLLIAATAINLNHAVATLNVQHFQRFKELEVIDAADYVRV